MSEMFRDLNQAEFDLLKTRKDFLSRISQMKQAENDTSRMDNVD